ncbi:MAG TPA: type VI secretion system baseplate subunit TssK, partial [Thermomonas sp.]|nr:type VI secretion system baseplate subunit TssK [Thermomonas sp.]
MNGDRQVHWGQGAFLSPQHLQAQDAWAQACRHALHLRMTPFPWGFESLRIREDALASGMVDVEQFTLVTHSGERLRGGSLDTAGGNTRVPQRNIADIRVNSSDPIPLFLVFNAERTLQGLSQRESERLTARHTLATDNLADPHDPQAPEAAVDFLLYQANLITGADENAEAIVRGSDSYKIAELVPAGPGKYKLSNDYIPPTTAILAANNLTRWTRALRDLLVSRGQDFAAIKRQRGIRAASTSAQEVMRVLMMQTFARFI